MTKFEKYIISLAKNEERKANHFLINGPRDRILVNAGIALNWIGDFFANPKIKWAEKELPIEKILFSGVDPKWNGILIDQCGRSVKKFRALIKKSPELRKKFKKQGLCRNAPILVRRDEGGKSYKVLDGMHRFVIAALGEKKKIGVLVPVNEKRHLPICEAHTAYDLIRGFIRNAKDKKGEIELYHALKLLCRTYENVKLLLKNRFNGEWVRDETVQKIIKRVLKNS